MCFSYQSKTQETASSVMLFEHPRNLTIRSSLVNHLPRRVLAMLRKAQPGEKHSQCLCFCSVQEVTLQTGNVIEHISIGEKEQNVGCQSLGGGKNRKQFTGYRVSVLLTVTLLELALPTAKLLQLASAFKLHMNTCQSEPGQNRDIKERYVS